MEDNFKEIKMVENGLIIILLFVIIIILLPSVTSLISKSMYISAQTSTQNTIEMTKELYTTINLTDEVSLPFKIEYDKDGYKIYSNGNEYIKTTNIKVDMKGKMPSSGSVEIDKNGYTTVRNLKFGIYKCNQIKSGNITCER